MATGVRPVLSAPLPLADLERRGDTPESVLRIGRLAQGRFRQLDLAQRRKGMATGRRGDRPRALDAPNAVRCPRLPTLAALPIQPHRSALPPGAPLPRARAGA